MCQRCGKVHDMSHMLHPDGVITEVVIDGQRRELKGAMLFVGVVDVNGEVVETTMLVRGNAETSVYLLGALLDEISAKSGEGAMVLALSAVLKARGLRDASAQEVAMGMELNGVSAEDDDDEAFGDVALTPSTLQAMMARLLPPPRGSM